MLDQKCWGYLDIAITNLVSHRTLFLIIHDILSRDEISNLTDRQEYDYG